MTKDERLLKHLLEQRAKGPFVTIEEGERRTREMIERKRRAIDQANAEVDAGRVISAGRMNAWIDSWDTEDEMPRPPAD